MGFLKTPDGSRVVGTLETIPGVALIGNVTWSPEFGIDFDYEGGTDVDWNGQETVKRNGRRVFVDEGGSEWLEDDLEYVEDEE